MEMPIDPRDIAYAENLLAAGEVDEARVLLQQLAEEAGEYADTACQATDARQWFSFADPFERLAYRRVEHDPRELTQIEAPFDRLYAALALTYIGKQEWEPARDALMQAVRWNPMNCTHRLNLAEVFRALGDGHEYAALSASVVTRASDARSLARAYANLGQYFLACEEGMAAEGCRRLAERTYGDDPAVGVLAEQLEREHPLLAEEPDETVLGAVTEQGIEAGANAEVAVCLLMCASDAAAEGRRNEATNYTLRARDLIGAPACEALIQLIRESDAELAAVEAQARAEAADGAAGAGVAAAAPAGAEGEVAPAGVEAAGAEGVESAEAGAGVYEAGAADSGQGEE